MSLFRRFLCIVVHHGHDPAPLATVRHIGLPPGVQAEVTRGEMCRRCGVRLA